MSWFLLGIALWVLLLAACWFLLDCGLAAPWRREDARGRDGTTDPGTTHGRAPRGQQP